MHLPLNSSNRVSQWGSDRTTDCQGLGDISLLEASASAVESRKMKCLPEFIYGKCTGRGSAVTKGSVHTGFERWLWGSILEVLNVVSTLGWETSSDEEDCHSVCGPTSGSLIRPSYDTVITPALIQSVNKLLTFSSKTKTLL